MDGHKKCFKCQVDKPLENFYKHKEMADGRFNSCKECNKAGVRKNYAEKKPQYQAYEKTRANLPHRVQARAEYSKTEAGKLSHQKSREKWLEDNRIKRAAHVIYGNWFRYNKETKPTSCTVCGSVKRLEAHHDDYFKPLEARYLCHKCHVSWHNENGEGLNGVTKQETK